MNYHVVSRADTCQHVRDLLAAGERVVINRFYDGEVNLMRDCVDGQHRSEPPGPICARLREAIRFRNQMVAINELKPANELSTVSADKMLECQRYLAEIGGRETYYSSNWAIHDYLNGGDLIAHFFRGKILFIGAWAHVVREKLSRHRPDFYIYATNRRNCGPLYEKYTRTMCEMASIYKFDTVIFACGPVGKVILTDMVGCCDSNLVDLGSMTNALIRQEDKWSMSWAANHDLDAINASIFARLR
jgi:hypothetical protein